MGLIWPFMSVKPDYQAYSPYPLKPFQLKILKASQPGGARLTCFTAGRGSAKTWTAGLAGAVATASGEEVVAIASAQHQARRLMTDCKEALLHRFGGQAFGYKQQDRFRVVDTTTMSIIEDRHSGGVFRALGSNPRSLTGGRSSLALFDEPASWYPGKALDLYNTIVGGLQKVKNGRAMIFGTRPASPDHWYERLLETDDPDVRIFRYQASQDDPPFHIKTIRKANPGFDFLDRDYVDFMIRTAKKDEVAKQSFLSQVLNLGVPVAPLGHLLITADEWKAARTLPEVERSGPLVIGFDLGGGGRSLTSCCGYWPATGRLESLSLIGGDLIQRGRDDRTGYDLYIYAEQEGGLRRTASKYPDCRVLLEWAEAEWGQPTKVTADRYRPTETEQVLQDFGWNDRYEGLSPAGRQGIDVLGVFKQALGDGYVRPAGPVRLLDYAASTARTRTLSDGNVVLETRDKPSGSQDDPVAAALLAVYVGRDLIRRRPVRPARFFGWADEE